MGDVLTRRVDFTLTRALTDNASTLEGYAAVFNTPTRIDSWEGTFDEVIAPGAFKKTLDERGDRVVLQFDHGTHPLVGSMPIGRIDALYEDDRGLFVRATLLDNDLVKPVRQAIEAGAIKGMSFRFEVIREQWSDDRDSPQVRTINEVRLHEVGPVVFPAYEETTVGLRAAEVVAELRGDNDFREQVIRLLAAAPETSADTSRVTDVDGRDTSKDDAAPVHVDRSGDHKTVVDRITAHIHERDAA